MTLVACGDGRRGVGRRGFARGAGWTAAGLAAVVLCAAPAVAEDAGGKGRAVAVPSEEADGLIDAELVGLTLSAADHPPLPGEEVLYRATVVNDGGAPVRGGLLAQHLPEPLEVVEVAQSGLMEEGVANWRVDLPEGEESVYTVRVRVPEDAEAGQRLVSTACLLLDRDAGPAACASETVLVADQTVLSRAGALVDSGALLRAAGAGTLLLLVWLLWRQWSGTRWA